MTLQVSMSSKVKRDLFFVSSLFVSIGIPVIAVVDKYNMIDYFTNAPEKIRWSILGAIMLVILFFSGYKKVKEYLNKLGFSWFKCFLYGTFKMLPLLAVLLLFGNMYRIIDDILFVIHWVIPCNVLSLYLLEPMYLYFQSKVEEEKTIATIQKAMRG